MEANAASVDNVVWLCFSGRQTISVESSALHKMLPKRLLDSKLARTLNPLTHIFQNIRVGSIGSSRSLPILRELPFAASLSQMVIERYSTLASLLRYKEQEQSDGREHHQQFTAFASQY